MLFGSGLGELDPEAGTSNRHIKEGRSGKRDLLW